MKEPMAIFALGVKPIAAGPQQTACSLITASSSYSGLCLNKEMIGSSFLRRVAAHDGRPAFQGRLRGKAMTPASRRDALNPAPSETGRKRPAYHHSSLWDEKGR